MEDFVEQKTDAFITLGLADDTLILYFNFHWPSKGWHIIIFLELHNRNYFYLWWNN